MIRRVGGKSESGCPFIYADLVDTSLHHNPFSHQQIPNLEYHKTENTINDKVDIVSNGPLQLSLRPAQSNKTLSSLTNEISTSEPMYGLEQKQEKMMKALTTSYSKRGSKHEQGDAQNQPIVPLLVADTFFDKVLGHGVDGVDITALSNAKEGKESFADLRTILSKNDAVSTSVSTIHKGQELRHSGQKSSSLRFKRNFPMANRMPKRSISGETRCTPATSTPALSEIRSSSGCGFVGKFRFMLPPNKTIFDINIDNFGEKLWRNPGANMSDFFNYGLGEKRWKDYCKLMATRVQVGRSGERKVTADESIQSHKQWLIGEVKSNRVVDERFKFPLANPKNGQSYPVSGTQHPDGVCEFAAHIVCSTSNEQSAAYGIHGAALLLSQSSVTDELCTRNKENFSGLLCSFKCPLVVDDGIPP
ncbi:UNVERIFIED_CONTAM: FIP1[V]-like protein [Sesamum angustifolium]|uniref:FIP1[V]-like protein n=1 Tax=Sesamum angustifolium TaxID=2727405 RepID=A0AAW2KYM6_9LAMI